MIKRVGPLGVASGAAEAWSNDLRVVIADGKGGIMPAWRGLLTEQELLDVVAYLRSLGQ